MKKSTKRYAERVIKDSYRTKEEVYTAICLVLSDNRLSKRTQNDLLEELKGLYKKYF